MGLVIGTNKVYFEYGKKNVNFFKSGRPAIKTKPTVRCVIENTETEEVIADKTVSLHHHDKNVKVIGRRFAVSKAINSLSDPELKSLLWNGIKDNIKLKA